VTLDIDDLRKAEHAAWQRVVTLNVELYTAREEAQRLSGLLTQLRKVDDAENDACVEHGTYQSSDK
jgi:hypothetical protein